MVLRKDIVVPDQQANRDRMVLARRNFPQQVSITLPGLARGATDQHHSRVEPPGNDIHAVLGPFKVMRDSFEHRFTANQRLDGAAMARIVNGMRSPDEPWLRQALIGRGMF